MDSKTKKIVLIASMILIVIAAVSLFYSVNDTKYFEVESGTYFCRTDVITEGNTKVYKWNIGISKINDKAGIIENEANREPLNKFRSIIGEMTKSRFEVFLLILNLIFILIIFATVQKDSQIFKNISNKKSFQLLTTLLIIFLIYKISIYFVELNRLYKDINFYFGIIS